MSLGEGFTSYQNEQDRQLRESAAFWQKLALEQLGYVLNLFLTFAVGSIGFAVKIMIEAKEPFLPDARWRFMWALPILGLSVLLGLSANITRTLDFRYTRRAARDNETRTDHQAWKVAGVLGKVTWWLFFTQALAFGVGAFLLCYSVLLNYSRKI
jgi:hypothetical protein